MNKLLVALLLGAFALGSVAAMADDKTPAEPVDQAKPKAETDAAKANAKAMTPEEEVAAKKAKRAAEREKALSRAERNAGPSGPYEAWTVEDAHRVDRELSTKRKPEKDAAKAAAAKMTPEEKAAARKAAREKRQRELDGPKPLPSGTPLPGYNAIDRRYLEPLPPERWPVKREPAKSNP